VTDIASRNFFLALGLSANLGDFTKSTKLPLDACMQTVDKGGYSIQTDTGQLGAVIYEVVVGDICEFGIFKHVTPELSHNTWPRIEDLSSTQGVWLGPMIEKCGSKGVFRTVHDL
jgi:hypothetical protein